MDAKKEDAGLNSVEESGQAPEQETGAAEEGRPKRYKIYDRIAANVSLRTIDIIIAVTAIALIGFVIYGIATGTALK